MQVIKDKKIIENTWQFIADDQVLPATGDISVSLTRWQQEKQQLVQRDSLLGVRLDPSEEVADLAEDLPKLALLELNFGLYTDGRGFSQARQLRHQYGYQGEVRAVGAFMLDQVYYLVRVGVNGFELENPQHLTWALESMEDFSYSYQPSTM